MLYTKMLSCILIFPKVPPDPLPPPYLVWIQDSEFSRNFGPHPLLVLLLNLFQSCWPICYFVYLQYPYQWWFIDLPVTLLLFCDRTFATLIDCNLTHNFQNDCNFWQMILPKDICQRLRRRTSCATICPESCLGGVHNPLYQKVAEEKNWSVGLPEKKTHQRIG